MPGICFYITQEWGRWKAEAKHWSLAKRRVPGVNSRGDTRKLGTLPTSVCFNTSTVKGLKIKIKIENEDTDLSGIKGDL